MAKSTILVLLSTTLISTGCRPNKGTASPEDYFGLIQVALQGGEVAAMIGRNEAIKSKNFAGCVASDVLTAAFDSAGDALSAKVTGTVIIPGFDIDLGDCMALREAPAEEDTASVVTFSTAVAAYQAPAEENSTEAEEAPAETEEPPAEEASTTEEAPAEETEAPTEEAPAEEEAPVATEAVQSSEDVAALVEAIAGVAILSGTHYATKLKATDCKKGELALSALGYLQGMIKPIADEIADPDGKISVPAVPVDLSACTEG
jgi:cell pole-organizing protein PopZ